uniref:F-box domain-containing protein n=1 Tax=Oryza rufipogon TaxID=4529 RepID=A0A0E0PQJ7_ORYRU
MMNKEGTERSPDEYHRNISDLPDDVLREILRRVNSRAALGAAALGKRWAGLARELPSLDLRVADILPRDYYLELRRRDEAKRSFWVYDYGKKYDAVIRRYERRAMRAMAACMKELSPSTPRRSVHRLAVEFIDTNSSNHINRLITTAVDAWGVEHLDVAAVLLTSSSSAQLDHPAYRFPDGRISDDPHGSRLRTLELTRCRPPDLRGFDALTTLVLRGLPRTTRAAERFKRDAALSALGYLCRAAINVTDLALRLTGPQMWVVPESPFLEMPSLRRLLVADVPPRWDATWIRAVVEAAAPSLERLHVHFSQHYRQDDDDPAADRRRLEIVWENEPSRTQHCDNLEELVVIGFQSKKERQVQFVRYVMEEASMALRRVVLIKHGHVEDRGPGEWEMVSQKCTWSDEEKLAVKEQIMEGVCCSMDQVELVLE